MRTSILNSELFPTTRSNNHSMIQPPTLCLQPATMMSKIRLHNNNGVRAFLSTLKSKKFDTCSDDVMNHFRRALALQFELEQNRQDGMVQPYAPSTSTHSDTEKFDSITFPIQESSLRRRSRRLQCVVSCDDLDEYRPMQAKKMRISYYSSGDHDNNCCSTSSAADTHAVDPYIPYLYLLPFLLHPPSVETDINTSTCNHIAADNCSLSHIWNSIILISNLAMFYHASDRSSIKAASLYQVALSLLQSIPSSSSFIDRTLNYYFVSMVLYNNYISWCYENNNGTMNPIQITENDESFHDWMEGLQRLIDNTHWSDNHHSVDKNDDDHWYYDPQVRRSVRANLQVMTAKLQQNNGSLQIA